LCGLGLSIFDEDQLLVLGTMPDLVSVDASHNQLSVCLGFTAGDPFRLWQSTLRLCILATSYGRAWPTRLVELGCQLVLLILFARISSMHREQGVLQNVAELKVK
jgi:hypothetical protein